MRLSNISYDGRPSRLRSIWLNISCLIGFAIACSIFAFFAPVVLTASVALWWFHPRRRVVEWFEIMDQSWCPQYFANLVQDVLHIQWFVALRSNGLHPAFLIALQRADPTRLIAIAAGGGGPEPFLVQHLSAVREPRPPVALILTDLVPNIPRWRKLITAHPTLPISYLPTPADATALPPTATLSGGVAAAAHSGATSVRSRPGVSSKSTTAVAESGDRGLTIRVLSASLHHFPPSLVRAIFADAVAAGDGIAILDGPALPQTVLTLPFMSLWFIPVTALVHMSPLRMLASCTVLPLIMLHDATTSALRMYSADELHGFAAAADPGGVLEWGSAGGRSDMPQTFWGLPKRS
eukprot:TRINITY_DN22881_c0_g1_i1.p1 TRINITY_DN22881_c0_g1~~TRINITY_DN22881_c0_g1_i1.p1  ORF type:complete len:351 (-),score=34.56 TRINITY_DN22881_c0_g1_i1:260-1312(-)